jgi:hypothetical protein
LTNFLIVVVFSSTFCPGFSVSFMPYLKFPQFSSNSLHAQVNTTVSAHPQGGVVQEKVALARDPKASAQPAASSKVARPPEADTDAARGQNHVSANAPKVQLPLHVKPIVNAYVTGAYASGDVNKAELFFPPRLLSGVPPEAVKADPRPHCGVGQDKGASDDAPK